MKLRQIPDFDRPREKLGRLGAGALSDAELLAIFLRTGTRSLDAVELAHKLLEKDGLRGLLDTSPADLCKLPGLGPAKAIALKAVLEISQRYLAISLKRGCVMSAPKEVRDFLKMQLRSHHSEVFACIFLDTRNRLIKFAKMFHGSIDRTYVYPRDIVREALELNAAAVIFAHNHPSGSAEPSRADKALTERLKNALQVIDVRVLDHLVVGTDDVSSFAELNLL